MVSRGDESSPITGQVVVLTTDIDHAVDPVIRVLGERHPTVRLVRFDPSTLLANARLEARFGPQGEITSALTVSRGQFRHECDLTKGFAVWYRRPMELAPPEGLSPQEQRFVRLEYRHLVAGLLSVPGRSAWVNSPVEQSQANFKLTQLQVAQRLGLDIPAGIATADPEQARSFHQEHREQGVVYKPLSPAAVGIFGKPYFIYATDVTGADESQWDSVEGCPVLLQARVPRRLELRITLVGHEVFCGAMDTSEIGDAVDFRTGYDAIRYLPYDLPTEIAGRLHALMDTFNLSYGAVDMIVTPDGRHVFLEVNPAGQYGWIEDELGLPITPAIAQLLATKAATVFDPAGLRPSS